MTAWRSGAGRLCLAAAVVSGFLVPTSAWWLVVTIPAAGGWLFLLVTERRAIEYQLGEEALQAAREWDAAHPDERAAPESRPSDTLEGDDRRRSEGDGRG